MKEYFIDMTTICYFEIIKNDKIKKEKIYGELTLHQKMQILKTFSHNKTKLPSTLSGFLILSQFRKHCKLLEVGTYIPADAYA